jgi:cytochrome c5
MQTPGRRWWIGAHGVAALGIVLLACSSGDDGESADTAVTTGAPVTSASTTVTAGTDAAPIGVSFASQVQPILESSCASCHQTGGPGAVHVRLDTADDARENALYIASAVDIGFMPPWPAGDGDLAFHDDRRLSDAQRQAILDWLDEGGSLDVDPATPLVATRSAITPIERDAVMVGEPYKGSTALRDDYRCQIYDPLLTSSSYLQGFGVEADRTEVVHHALLFRASAATRSEFEQISAADPDVGWECGGLVGTGNAELIMSWAPGQDPTILPADTGLAMEPGDFFVTQIHYHYEPASDGLAPDETAIVADFASDEVIAAAGGQLDPIELELYLGPAEIPCSTREIGPLCDRNAAKQALVATGGPGADIFAEGLLAQCGKSPADFAGMTDGKASSSCDLDASPGQIVSVWGHLHELGDTFRLTLNPGRADETVLLDIPKWDFDWQLLYWPVDDVIIEPGDTIRVECSWDRRFIPEDAEPRYVMWAEGTNDEMCYSQIVTRPVESPPSP